LSCRLLLRGSALAGVVYYTRSVGIWADTDRTHQLLDGVKAQLCPYVQKAKKQLPFEVPKLPGSGEVRFLAKHYYNEGVKNSFRFVHMLPCYAGRGLKKVKDTFESFAESPAIAGGEAKK
ncbi:hypothetical protein KR018_008656, partial [Drosophila ironensis]